MADLTPVAVPVAGGLADVAASAVAATALGDTAPTGPGLALYVNNGGGVSRTVTVATPRTMAGLAVADATLVVAAGDHGIIPLPTRPFGGADLRAAITYDAVTSLTVAVLDLEDR